MKYLPLLLLFVWSALAQPANTFPRTANTAADLGVLPIPYPTQPPTRLTALILGVNDVGDGNGGMFYWSYQETSPGDGQNIFLSTNAVFADSGRWIRFPLVAPTPGQVTTPTFSPSNGAFENSVDVTISTTTSGATLYYTLDGSDPTTASTLYSGAITLTNTTVIKAFGVRSDLVDSDIATKAYTYSFSVAAPVISFDPPEDQMYLFSDQPGFPVGCVWSMSTTTVGASIWYLTDSDTAFTPSIDPPSQEYFAPGGFGSSGPFKAIAYLDGEYSAVTYAFHSIELPVFWGYTNLTTLSGTDARNLAGGEFDSANTYGGVLRFSYAQESPIIIYDVPAGSFVFDVNSTVSDYYYFAFPQDYPAPAAINGFMYGAFPIGMAGPADGYTDGPENGWYYQLVTVDTGIQYKVYRTANQIGGGGVITIELQ